MKKWWRSNLTMIMAAVAILSLIVPATAGAAEPGAKKLDKAAASCVETAKGPLGAAKTQESEPGHKATAPLIKARVGKPAPDFEANALIDGGFKNIKLSDYKGRWVVLCFYPGDFTFV